MRGRFTTPGQAMRRTAQRASSWRNGRCKTMRRMRSPPCPRGLPKAGQELGKLVREQQDLLGAREAAYRSLDAAAGKADAKAAEAARAAIANIEARLAEKQAALRQAFPDYAELANPKPLSLADAQALLGEGDALVLFLDLWQIGNVPEETIVFALTKKEARWTSLPLGTRALRERVTALRCGLDRTNWREGQESRETCKKLLSTEVSEDRQPPFDAAAAHALYRDLFGGVEDLIKDKSLLIVPSGALTQLPFEALVTEKPDASLPRFEAYKSARWLGQRQAVTVLPSVGSLKALRTAKGSAATELFAGFGNPLLDGVDGKDKSAWAKQTCPKSPAPGQTRIASLSAAFLSIFRGGQVSVEDLRHQPPLPETADELCQVAKTLGVPEARLDSAVYLGERATVAQVKALSASGDLARARVVHFATHGLLAGETALFAKNKAEPALLLTPPPEASDEDNGLLTASEVAQLNLNADWVVMSACNTAGGIGGWRGGAVGARPRVLLCRRSLAARLALGGGFRGRRRHHHRRDERDEGRAQDRPRRGAAPVHRRAHRQGRPLRASKRVGAVRAGGQWGAVTSPTRKFSYLPITSVLPPG